MSSEAKLGHYFDFKGDARRVFEVLQKGGVAICPATIGYGVITSDPRKLETIFLTKQRAATKRHANVGSYATHRELHVMDQRSRDIVDHLVLDLDVPLAVIAPFKEDHPMFKKLDEVTMQAASVNGTIAILVNAGPFQDELTKLSLAANLPILGSSANLTQTGMFHVGILVTEQI
jgi:tRNA A37 threonylcarbamoyladenosine synthetase subunit TsaC/SUA5/YrdC